jgi:membrane protein implicated in regulation of membrane protease activity
MIIVWIFEAIGCAVLITALLWSFSPTLALVLGIAGSGALVVLSALLVHAIRREPKRRPVEGQLTSADPAEEQAALQAAEERAHGSAPSGTTG